MWAVSFTALPILIGYAMLCYVLCVMWMSGCLCHAVNVCLSSVCHRSRSQWTRNQRVKPILLSSEIAIPADTVVCTPLWYLPYRAHHGYMTVTLVLYVLCVIWQSSVNKLCNSVLVWRSGFAYLLVVCHDCGQSMLTRVHNTCINDILWR